MRATQFRWIPLDANELKLTQQEAIVVPIRSLIIFAITGALPVGLWVTPAYAQDPAIVNSKTIRVRFENDRVRVLEAILPPGTKEQVHSHPAYVIYVLAGGRYRNYADRKSTRLNSSHRCISYAVFCLKKKNNKPIRLEKHSRRRSDPPEEGGHALSERTCSRIACVFSTGSRRCTRSYVS